MVEEANSDWSGGGCTLTRAGRDTEGAGEGRGKGSLRHPYVPPYSEQNL